MADYGSIKTMKACAIGTIMPWVGDLTEVPRGWLICNGNDIPAGDFPLLTQVIKNTYGGTVPATGPGSSFPEYAGTITLPNISQRALSDVDSAYFAGGAIRPNIDTADALAAVSTYIGPGDTDNGVPGEFNDIYTDIMFSYTPENDFSGRITGSTYDPGFGAKTVFTSARKLGRRHTPTHSHPTTVPSINKGIGTEGRAGDGVSCSRQISYKITKAYFDDLLAPVEVDINYFSPSGTAFGNGAPGVVLGNVLSEAVPQNGIPREIFSHGLSNWFGSSVAPDIPAPYSRGGGDTPEGTPGPPNFQLKDRNFEPLDSAPYGPGGSNIRVAQRNFDNGGANSDFDQHRPYEVMFNHSGISFNKVTPTAGISDVITSHTHETFDITFDKSSLRMPTTITANVRSDVVPQNVPSALNTKVITQTPSVIVMYIIRAY